MIQQYLPPAIPYKPDGVGGQGAVRQFSVPTHMIVGKPRRALRRGKIVYTTRLQSQPRSPRPAGATHSAVESFWNEDI